MRYVVRYRDGNRWRFVRHLEDKRRIATFPTRISASIVADMMLHGTVIDLEADPNTCLIHSIG